MAAPMHLPKLNICIYNQFCTNSPRYSRRETISQLILWDSKTRLGHYKKSVQASIFSEHICRQSKKKKISNETQQYIKTIHQNQMNFTPKCRVGKIYVMPTNKPINPKITSVDEGKLWTTCSARFRWKASSHLNMDGHFLPGERNQ